MDLRKALVQSKTGKCELILRLSVLRSGEAQTFELMFALEIRKNMIDRIGSLLKQLRRVKRLIGQYANGGPDFCLDSGLDDALVYISRLS